jgi:hypothetical protein
MLPAALRDMLDEVVGTAGVVRGLESLSNRVRGQMALWDCFELLGTLSMSSVGRSTPWLRMVWSRTHGVPRRRHDANLGLRLGGCACRDDRWRQRGWHRTLCPRPDWSPLDRA